MTVSVLRISQQSPPVRPLWRESVEAFEGTWWVAHTKSRFEKAFASDLLARKVDYFLPLIEQVRLYGKKKKRVIVPLFPGYVFFCGTDVDRYEAMTTNRLCQTIDVADQEALGRQLAAIETALESGASLDPYPHAAVGNRCRVRSGPFRGLEGVVTQRNDETRLILEVDMLGQGASLEIDASLLEAAE